MFIVNRVFLQRTIDLFILQLPNGNLMFLKQICQFFLTYFLHICLLESPLYITYVITSTNLVTLIGYSSLKLIGKKRNDTLNNYMLKIDHFFKCLIQEKQILFFLLINCCNQGRRFYAWLSLYVRTDDPQPLTQISSSQLTSPYAS